MSDPLPVYTEMVRYLVSCLPDNYPARRHFALAVEYRGINSWAVCAHGGCFATDGEWGWEPSPSGRDDDYTTRWRMPLTEALELARRLAPTITCNGVTVTEALARGVEWS